MSRYRLSRQARLDLDDIWLHIAQGNVTAADRFIDALADKFRILADEPGVGPLRSELARGVRSFPLGKYVIFYRAIQDGLEIVRVLSGFRDISALFTTE
ncbi:MAG: type II toxin-antitoxin system RelE/ParE family toxin [Phycisphaerae bacterium]|jgi:toxin ParE1/3/4